MVPAMYQPNNRTCHVLTDQCAASPVTSLTSSMVSIDYICYVFVMVDTEERLPCCRLPVMVHPEEIILAALF